MLGRLLEAFVFLLVLRAAWTVLTTFLAAGRRANRAASGDRPAVKLVRDPVCGTFVSPATAISDGRHHFCSETCRNEYKLRA